ncbi:class I SAM-dependent methyltransferase [Dankookia sp. GCM10030260]|uniref:class I SAM-dependent methyltransferase n=1 Tax=Dankookia sp. GCM10030260 TaxID=3273390 RepID=UPI00360971AA
MSDTKLPPGTLAAAQDVGRDWIEAAYFAEAEPAADLQWATIILPFLQIEATGIDLAVTLDLAAGHGRNAAKLLPLAGRLHVVDIHASNVEICRRRFGDDPRIAYAANDGCSLPVPDAALSFLFCFDAMVHFDSDVVRAYLREARRALAPGGHAFLHHSNDMSLAGGDFRRHPHWRNTMSLDLMRHYAVKEGLQVVRQQALDWAHDGSDIDGLTLLWAP